MQILSSDEMRRAITRLAMQAVECCKGTDFVLIGIRTRGVILARRMQREIARLEGVQVPLGILDISLYRDDLLDGCDAVFKGSEIDFDLDGRTVRAALAALASMGRARAVRLFTLIDRGHRELPFRADGVGKSVPTSRKERVVVRFTETDGADSVELYKTGE